MEGRIGNYRMARHHFTGNQMIVYVDEIDTKEKAAKLVGKQVIFNTGKKDIKGKVAKAHGNKGALKVLFESGMPGQAIGQKVTLK